MSNERIIGNKHVSHNHKQPLGHRLQGWTLHEHDHVLRWFFRVRNLTTKDSICSICGCRPHFFCVSHLQPSSLLCIYCVETHWCWSIKLRHSCISKQRDLHWRFLTVEKQNIVLHLAVLFGQASKTRKIIQTHNFDTAVTLCHPLPPALILQQLQGGSNRQRNCWPGGGVRGCNSESMCQFVPGLGGERQEDSTQRSVPKDIEKYSNQSSLSSKWLKLCVFLVSNVFL